jgi:hypothetical protein
MPVSVSPQYLLEGAVYALEQCGLLLRDANLLYRNGCCECRRRSLIRTRRTRAVPNITRTPVRRSLMETVSQLRKYKIAVETTRPNKKLAC